MLIVAHFVRRGAPAKDYIRRSQERLIAQLRASPSSAAAMERRRLELLGAGRGQSAEQSYGPGNAVNLLRRPRGDLRGLDLSRLSIRQAYPPKVEAPDASLAGAHLTEAVLAEALDYPTSVALSVDGASLAAGTSTGRCACGGWRIARRC